MTAKRLTVVRFLRRSLVHRARAHALLLLAAATGVAIVVGALLVGDSVRGSLEDRVRERLGRVEAAVFAGSLARQELARDLEGRLATMGPGLEVVPGIVLRGAVESAESRERAADVVVLGVPEGFWGLEEEGGRGGLAEGAPWAGRQAALSAPLARAIGARTGEAVLVRFERPGGVPAEHALGRREERTQTLRLDVARILEERGLGLFGLENSQAAPRTCFVPLETLARLLGKVGRANAFWIAAKTSKGSDREGSSHLSRAVWRFQSALAEAFTLEDAGLRVTASAVAGDVRVESESLLLQDAVVVASRRVGGPLGARARETLAYLANTIAAGGRDVPYSTVVGTPSVAGVDLQPGDVALNAWAAADLHVKPGDEVRLAYYALDDAMRLVEREARFRLRAVVKEGTEAYDPGWVPEYPGVTDARSLKEWNPPFPVDLKRIRPEDEAYWDRYRATPKAFVAIEDARRLWSSRFGRTTAVRLAPPEGVGGGATFRDAVARFLTAALDPADLGLLVRPLRQEGLAAARSGTDFGQLFLGLSFFLIVSALVLLSMTNRLSLERRLRELGVLLALGGSRGAVLRLVLLEASSVLLLGAALGGVAGIGYAAAMMEGLRTWWSGAVNAPFLATHVTAASLVGGTLGALLLQLVTLWLSVRRAVRVPPRSLLAGSGLDPAGPGARSRGPSRRSAVLSVALLGLGAGLIAYARLASGVPLEAAFFGGGILLLAGFLLGVARLLRRGGAPRPGQGVGALARLAMRSAARNPGRSLLTVVVVACASFLLVTVTALRRDPGAGAPEKSAGDGGYALLGRTSAALTARLDTQEGAMSLGLREETIALLAQARVEALRYRPGDDASCLNLHRPGTPRILGVPRSFRARGGFAWASSLAETDEERANPWRLLERAGADGAVPVVGDQNTLQWILHVSVGETLEVADDSGRPVRLRVVGALAHSIFSSDLLIADERFEHIFPLRSGHGGILIEAPPDVAAALVPALETDLADWGLDLEPTGDILRTFQAVENTYLLTFEALGALGLLLGTLGLGAVLLRNVEERRGELALLRALGYARGHLALLVLLETLYLVTLGLASGAASALLAVAPAAGAAAGTEVPWRLGAALLSVLLVGAASCGVALRAALRVPLLPALRAE